MSADMADASAASASDGETKSSNSSKLNKVVERLKDVSREPSPEPASPASSVKESGKGSSRRKPKVTHKVVDTDDDAAASGEEEKDEPPFQTYNNANGVNGQERDAKDKESEDKTEEDKSKEEDDAIDVDEEGNPILPEGTVMVQPVAVDERRPRFQGPEFRKRRRSGDIEAVHCTGCNRQINTNSSGSVFRHPVLKVLLCKKCYNWYTSDIISKDDEGDDEQCTWCGDGGNLFICDCQHAVCRNCVQRHLGRAELKRTEEDDDWRCYICEPGPLEKLRKECDRVIETVEEMNKKRQQERDQLEQKKKERIQKKEEREKAKPVKPVSLLKSTPPKKTTPQTNVSQQIMQQIMAQNKGQVLMQVRGQPGNLVLVPKGTAAGSMIATNKGKVILDHPSGASAKSPSSSIVKQDYIVTTENVVLTLDRALTSTESMALLLKTLKDDLRPALQASCEPAKARSIKLEVAKKLRRALDAQVRNMNDLYQFTKSSAAPKTALRPIMPAATPNRSLLKPVKSSSQPTPPRVQDVPELAGMNIGEVLTQNKLTAAIGDKVIISKETLSNRIQLVTLSDGRVLAVQTAPGVKKPGAPATSPAKPPVDSGDVIELDSSDEDSPQKSADSPPPQKKYRPGPKCSKGNKPGPKSSKIAKEQDKGGSDSEDKKGDKFKMRISLGAKSFPEASKSKADENESDGGKSNPEDTSHSSDDDKPLKPKVTDSTGSKDENEKDHEETESKDEKKEESKDAEEDKEEVLNDKSEKEEEEEEEESPEKKNDSKGGTKKDEDDENGSGGNGSGGDKDSGENNDEEKDSNEKGDPDDPKREDNKEEKMDVDQEADDDMDLSAPEADNSGNGVLLADNSPEESAETAVKKATPRKTKTRKGRGLRCPRDIGSDSDDGHSKRPSKNQKTAKCVKKGDNKQASARLSKNMQNKSTADHGEELLANDTHEELEEDGCKQDEEKAKRKDEMSADDESSDVEEKTEKSKSPKKPSHRKKSSEDTGDSANSYRKRKSKRKGDNRSGSEVESKELDSSTKVVDKAREALLADDSSSEKETIADNKDKTKEINEKARQALLADSSSDDSNLLNGVEEGSTEERSEKVRQSLSADCVEQDKGQSGAEPSSVKERNEKARQALLADSSSEEENSSLPSPKIKGKGKILNPAQDEQKEKARQSLLADSSSEENSQPKTPKGKPVSKAQRRLSQKTSSLSEDKENVPVRRSTSGRTSEDKENVPAKKLLSKTQITKESIPSFSHSDIIAPPNKLDNIKTEVESDAEEYTTGFVVLGEYDRCTQEIRELDQDLLLQLDGTGDIEGEMVPCEVRIAPLRVNKVRQPISDKGLTSVLNSNGQCQSDATDSDSDSSPKKKQKGKGKSSPKFPSKSSKKNGANKDDDSDQTDVESEEEDPLEPSDTESDSLKGSDKDFQVNFSPSGRARRERKRETEDAMESFRLKRKKLRDKAAKETKEKKPKVKESNKNQASSSDKSDSDDETTKKHKPGPKSSKSKTKRDSNDSNRNGLEKAKSESDSGKREKNKKKKKDDSDTDLSDINSDDDDTPLITKKRKIKENGAVEDQAEGDAEISDGKKEKKNEQKSDDKMEEKDKPKIKNGKSKDSKASRKKDDSVVILSSSDDEGDVPDINDDDDSNSELDEEQKEELERKKNKAKEIEKKVAKEGHDRSALLDSGSEAEASASDVESDADLVEKKKPKKKAKRKRFHERDYLEIDYRLVIDLSDIDETNWLKKEQGIKIKKKKPARKTIVVDDMSSLSDSSVDERRKKKKGKKKKKGSEESDFSPDSDSEPVRKKKRRKRKRSSSSSEDSETHDLEKKARKKAKKNKRRRIKKESESDDGSGDEESKKGRKQIKKILKDKKLAEDTKEAGKAEEERRKRIKERQKLFNEEVEVDKLTKQSVTTKCVLEMTDDDAKEPLIEVSPGLIRKLKPHQVEAVKFIWDCCCESVSRMKDEEGGGCILAHCMGLGKTLSMITFLHTLMRNGDDTGIHRAMVVCPLNTVLNWEREWLMWSEEVPEDEQYDVHEMASAKSYDERTNILKRWHRDGGLLVIGYEMFRNLTLGRFIKKKRHKEIVRQTLIDPGADVVVCDEGHILKNSESAVSKAVSTVKSKRRIVLTGTPLQNNLIEYHCMVDFVKPRLLGTLKEFRNRFVNPITNGQCADSSRFDVKLMKRRAHILHETLDGCVQRRDYSALAKFLPPKHEFVISIRMTKVQIALYRKYLEKAELGEFSRIAGKGARLFSDYQSLMRIWTHPWVLKLGEIRDENRKQWKDEDDFIDDEDEESEMSFHSSESDEPGVSNTKPTRRSARQRRSSDDSDDDSDKEKRKQLRQELNNSDEEVTKNWKTKSRGGEGGDHNEPPPEEEADGKVSSEWWAEFVSEADQFNVELSGKIHLLSEVLKMCESIGDKVLVFSQSLLSLDLIEDFLCHWHEDIRRKLAEENDGIVPIGVNQWLHGFDYFRMDGSTSPQNRKRWSDIFNDENNIRSRLFLISTKAGSLGTNMVGANRVIIFDASWNPSHDVQSIFRVYRFGQTKPCYIYRFLAQGTMEEKIYRRQIDKQSLAARVVDEHQIDRHFTYSDLKDLYIFEPAEDDVQEIPAVPSDRLLAEMLSTHKDLIVKYHEHDSLLENKVDQELSEEERKAAWEEFEQEKKGLNLQQQRSMAMGYGGMGYMQQGTAGFNSMVMQMQQGNMTMYTPMQQANYGMAANNAYVQQPQPQTTLSAAATKEVQDGINVLTANLFKQYPAITSDELQRRIEPYANHLILQQMERERRLQMQNHQRLMQLQGAQVANSTAGQQLSGGLRTTPAPIAPAPAPIVIAPTTSTSESGDTSSSDALRSLLRLN